MEQILSAINQITNKLSSLESMVNQMNTKLEKVMLANDEKQIQKEFKFAQFTEEVKALGLYLKDYAQAHCPELLEIRYI